MLPPASSSTRFSTTLKAIPLCGSRSLRGRAVGGPRRWADEILKCAPLAVRFTRQLAIEALEGEGFAALIGRRSRDVAARLFATEDTKEGIRAFVEKREPIWRGR